MYVGVMIIVAAHCLFHTCFHTFYFLFSPSFYVVPLPFHSYFLTVLYYHQQKLRYDVYFSFNCDTYLGSITYIGVRSQ